MTKCSQERILFSISDVYLQRLPSGLSDKEKAVFPAGRRFLSATKKQVMKQLYTMVIKSYIHRLSWYLPAVAFFPLSRASSQRTTTRERGRNQPADSFALRRGGIYGLRAYGHTGERPGAAIGRGFQLRRFRLFETQLRLPVSRKGKPTTGWQPIGRATSCSNMRCAAARWRSRSWRSIRRERAEFGKRCSSTTDRKTASTGIISFFDNCATRPAVLIEKQAEEPSTITTRSSRKLFGR